MGKVGRLYRESLVQSVKEGLEQNTSAFLLSFSAVESSRMNELRKDLGKIGASVYVAKNRIAQIALKNFHQERLAGKVSGQTAFVWTNADSAMVSKMLVQYTQKCEGLSIQGLVLDGTMLDQNDVKRLSDLPSRDVLVAQLLQVILSPLTRLALVLNGKTRDLLSVLKQLSEKKGGS